MNMDKKYELIKNDFIKKYGITLYRIKALKDFGNVKAGDSGGYIQSEHNLSQDGNAWVSDNASIFGNAEISGNGLIYSNA